MAVRGMLFGVLVASQLRGTSAGGVVWGGVQDDWTLTFWITCGLVTLAMAFDYVLHNLTHWLEHLADLDSHGHGHDHGHKKFDLKDYAGSVNRITYQIWVRFQSEMMVLGCLAFTIWVVNQCEGFEAMAEWVIEHGQATTPPGGSGSGSASHAQASASGSSAHTSGSSAHTSGSGIASGSGSGLGRMLSAGSVDPLSWGEENCPRHLPIDAGTWLHASERVHFVLFITTLFYFASLMLGLHRYFARLRAYGECERRLAKGEEQKTGSHKRRTKSIKAIRNYLTIQPEMQKHEEIKALHNQEPKLSVRAFLQRTSKDNIAKLIEFPLLCWFKILLYSLIIALLCQFACLDIVELEAIEFGLFIFASAYLVMRLLIFRHILFKSTNLKASDGHELVPYSIVDKVLCVCTFGMTGFRPGLKKPDEKAALTNIQSVMWLMWYFIVDIMMNPLTYDNAPLLHEILPACVLLGPILLMSFVVIPDALEMFALPPYLTEEEQGFVIETLKHFPEGFCPDDGTLQYAQDNQIERITNDLSKLYRNHFGKDNVKAESISSTSSAASAETKPPADAI